MSKLSSNDGSTAIAIRNAELSDQESIYAHRAAFNEPNVEINVENEISSKDRNDDDNSGNDDNNVGRESKRVKTTDIDMKMEMKIGQSVWNQTTLLCSASLCCMHICMKCKIEEWIARSSCVHACVCACMFVCRCALVTVPFFPFCNEKNGWMEVMPVYVYGHVINRIHIECKKHTTVNEWIWSWELRYRFKSNRIAVI